MSNTFRGQDEDTVEEEKLSQKMPNEELKINFLSQFLKDGALNVQTVTATLPFVLFLVFMGMLYITNIHIVENKIRNIEKLDKEVKELGWEFKTSKAELMYRSKQTEVSKMVDTLGLKELTAPPRKIEVNLNEYKK